MFGMSSSVIRIACETTLNKYTWFDDLHIGFFGTHMRKFGWTYQPKRDMMGWWFDEAIRLFLWHEQLIQLTIYWDKCYTWNKKNSGTNGSNYVAAQKYCVFCCASHCSVFILALYPPIKPHSISECFHIQSADVWWLAKNTTNRQVFHQTSINVRTAWLWLLCLCFNHDSILNIIQMQTTAGCDKLMDNDNVPIRAVAVKSISETTMWDDFTTHSTLR